mgnify:CR=1 FL=1
MCPPASKRGEIRTKSAYELDVSTRANPVEVVITSIVEVEVVVVGVVVVVVVVEEVVVVVVVVVVDEVVALDVVVICADVVVEGESPSVVVPEQMSQPVQSH